MDSKPNKAWNNVRLLHSVTEGLQREGDPAAPSAQNTASAHNKERKQQRRTKKAISVSPDTGEAQSHGDGQQEETPTPRDPKRENIGPERLAQIRSQLRAQLSIRESQEDPSSGSWLVELVDKITHGERNDGAGSVNGGADAESIADRVCAVCRQHRDPAGYVWVLPAEVEKLQKELAELRGEVTAGIEAIRKDMAKELNSLRQILQAYGAHHALQPSELSLLGKQDEATSDQPRATCPRGGQRENPGGKLPSTLQEQFKARSVPSLCPVACPNRNQVLIRAITLVTAKKGQKAKLGPRSNSDPVDPLQAKSTLPPPANLKSASKKLPKKIKAPTTGKSHQETPKYGHKLASRMVVPHPLCDSTEGNAH